MKYAQKTSLSKTNLKGSFKARKNSINKLFKIKRRDQEYDGKLPFITTNKSESKTHMKTTRAFESFSQFDSAVRSTTHRYFSHSPRKSKNTSKISKCTSKSKYTNRSKAKQATLPAPFMVKRNQNKVVGSRIDRSRSKNDIIHSFPMVEKLTKKRRIYV